MMDESIPKFNSFRLLIDYLTFPRKLFTHTFSLHNSANFLQKLPGWFTKTFQVFPSLNPNLKHFDKWRQSGVLHQKHVINFRFYVTFILSGTDNTVGLCFYVIFYNTQLHKFEL